MPNACILISSPSWEHQAFSGESRYWWIGLSLEGGLIEVPCVSKTKRQKIYSCLMRSKVLNQMGEKYLRKHLPWQLYVYFSKERHLWDRLDNVNTDLLNSESREIWYQKVGGHKNYNMVSMVRYQSANGA